MTSLQRGIVELLKSRKVASLKKKSAKEMEQRWYLDDYLLSVQSYSISPILSSEGYNKGNASLYTTASTLYNDEPCLKKLINRGVVVEPIINEYFTITQNTNFVIPETCYDITYENPKLPEKVYTEEGDTEARDYCVTLSDLQIPKERYSYLYQEFFEEVLVKEENVNKLKISPFSKKRLLKNQHISDLNKQLTLMAVSNEPSARLSVCKNELEGHDIKKCSNFQPDPSLMPRPLEECEIYYDVFEHLAENLSDYCSYSYKDEQIHNFKSATNHVIRGNCCGGLMFALYVDGEESLSREMFVKSPSVEMYQNSSGLPLTFACLYPPSDKENWKKYAVCTSTIQDGALDIRSRDFMISLLKNVFMCEDEEGNKRQPYCVFQSPYLLQCNCQISSFVRYLPSESGWVDVYNDSVNVYSQVMLFVTTTVFITGYALGAEYLSKARLMYGNPMTTSENLGKNNSIFFKAYDYNVMEDSTLGNFHEDSVDPYTVVFNDYAYLSNAASSPCDFTMKNTVKKDDQDDQHNTLVHELYVLRAQEVIHKMSD